MPLFYFKNLGDTRIGIWKTDESVEELLQIAHIGKEILNVSSNPKRQTEIAAVRALLYMMCNELKEISYKENGKPYLKDESMNISISHTKGYVAVILSNTSSVGIDIEKFSDTVIRVKDKFLTLEEQKVIEYNPEKIKEALIICWSAKETMFKIMEEEEVDFCDHLRIYPFYIKNNIDKIFTREFKTIQNKEFKIHFLIENDFVLTYCINNIHILTL